MEAAVAADGNKRGHGRLEIYARGLVLLAKALELLDFASLVSWLSLIQWPRRA
jgi:hypothetical protein